MRTKHKKLWSLIAVVAAVSIIIYFLPFEVQANGACDPKGPGYWVKQGFNDELSYHGDDKDTELAKYVKTTELNIEFGFLSPDAVYKDKHVGTWLDEARSFVNGIEEAEDKLYKKALKDISKGTKLICPGPTPTVTPVPTPTPTATSPTQISKPKPAPTPTATPVPISALEITAPVSPNGVEQVVVTIFPWMATTVAAPMVDVTIHIPAGSVTELVQLAVRTVSSEDIPVSAVGFSFTDTVFIVAIFDAAGNPLPDFEFENYITMTIQITEDDLAANDDPDGIVIQRFDEGVGDWVSLPTTVDPLALTARGSTRMLSLFGLAMQKIVRPSEPDIVVVLRPTEATTVAAPDGGVRIEVPRVATVEPVQIALTLLAPEDVSTLPQGIELAQRLFRIDVFDLGGEVLPNFRFDRALVTTVQFTSQDLRMVNNDISRIVILRFEQSAQQWIVLPAYVDIAELTATFVSKRFSLFALGLIGVEAPPTPTPISDAELRAKRAERPVPQVLVDNTFCNLLGVRCQ